MYEIVLALLLLGTIWLLRRRLRSPSALLWTVVGLYAGGRFIMFFYRVDSNDLASGLDTSQWISLMLVGVAAAGLIRAFRPRSRLRRRRDRSCQPLPP